ncbi:MAG: aminotransferase class I/II-fold pyridoxal phosphate-dependent enzyme [Deltaproteobacteria bacterium]|nr:aminotransferase class I/II-fold pyridoxal phosphate-dependent enzyme [Deltaproteobacteria bacterium]
MPVVDLRSDTVTRPTEAMKKAMMAAPLGDDVLGDDPTVKRLEAAAAERAGKEGALFTPSGTMANQIALALLTRPGDEVLMEAGAHPFNYEAAGGAVIAGVQIRAIPGQLGILDPLDVERHIRPTDPHFAPATLLCVEDTSNRGGGTVHTLDQLDALTKVAREAGLRTHLDGARAFNAVVASGVPLARRASGFDTVSFCFSKGLGAPVGSVLCGPLYLMERARRIRKMLGGGMRQSGILAAACLYALEHHVDRLAEDHQRARDLSMGLMMDGYDVRLPQTNILFVTVSDAPELQRTLEERGVLCLPTGPDTLRLVLHLDVDEAGVEQALQAFAELKGIR